MKNFIFTCGDVNGIGPEIVIKSLNKIVFQKRKYGYYFICPGNVYKKAISLIEPKFDYLVTSSFKQSEPGIVTIINSGDVKIQKGEPTEVSGAAAFISIQTAFAMLKNNLAEAVVTAPISKTAIKMAKVKYSGHTEMFADWCGTKDYAMTFLSSRMKAALATIHIPVKNVSSSVTREYLKNLIQILVRTLIEDLNIEEPSIAILGLNPHAGENGNIGTEEEKIIKPVISKSFKKAFITGPYSPDAFFANKLYKNFDLILGMYHDQILIPFKMMNFNKGVNYTAGLPVIRTSPDHGTAYDIAWANMANPSSMIEAFKYSELIANNRKRYAPQGKRKHL